MNPLSLLSLALLLLQAAVHPQTQSKPTGSIEGTITRAGSNQLIAGARVTLTRRLTPNVPAAIPPAITDGKGKFFFSGLDDGAYSIQVQADGYMPQAYATLGATASLVNVNGGQPTKEINVALTPKANLGGRVSDTSDQPLINVPVQLLRYAYDSQGQRAYQVEGTTTTNDRGDYRLTSVNPGRYYLLAGKPSTGSNSPAVAGGYAFYPGTKEIANAVLIDLQPGMDLPSMDLALEAKPRTFRIRGTIVDSRTGQFPTQTNIFVAPQVPGLNANAGSPGDLNASSPNYDPRTGIFEMRDLLPGSYAILATATDPPAPGEAGPSAQSSALLPVTVALSDVDNLTIPLVPAGTLPGRIRFEGQAPAQLTTSRVLVRLVPSGPNAPTSLSGIFANVFKQNAQAIAAPDGTFQIKNLIPGDYRIEVYFPPANIPLDSPFATLRVAGAYIKNARLDGVDVMNDPIRFSGATSSGLEVTLAFGSGGVITTATDARLQPVRAGRVVAVPARARFRTELFRALTTDENGQSGFTLPPGDYKLFAWESIEENGWFDPDLLARSENRAVSVTVSSGSTQSINVQIIPAGSNR